jgi:hypothetical protein
MLGPVKERRLDRPVLASLDQLVPRNNFYRQLEATLDLAFVRDWVSEKYAEGGRPSIDPVVFFKPQTRHYPYSGRAVCARPHRGHRADASVLWPDLSLPWPDAPARPRARLRGGNSTGD